ncbi:MAG TPA: FecR domain-containing protein [Chiayiivirga sp.]|nr:FecR domain-containing protein [Chiayiivirga sp.]
MLDHNTIEEQAAHWLARLDAGSLSEGDQQAMRQWIAASVAHRVAFLRLEELWRQSGRLRALAHDSSLDGASAGEVDSRPEAPLHAKPRHRPWAHALLAVFALVAVGLAALYGWQVSGEHRSSHSSGIGQIQTLSLLDGSSLTLGSNSEVTVVLTRQRRSIELVRGEAIFAVAHDPDRPFVVHSNAHQIVAVGTRFSVRRNDEALRVVVTEGRVQLRSDRADSDSPTRLMPAGSVADVDASGIDFKTLSPDQVERMLDWRDGYLSFDDTALSEVVAEFNRYHQRKLELADATVGQLRVGGTFRWANLDGFVHLLERGFPVRVERLPNRIRLHRN